MKQHFLLNEYEDGWSIQYTIFGIWKVFKGNESHGAFGIYEDAERHLRKLQEEERCKQQKASCLAQGA